MMSSQYTMSTYDLPQSPLNLLADNKHRRNPPLTALQGYTQALEKGYNQEQNLSKTPKFLYVGVQSWKASEIRVEQNRSQNGEEKGEKGKK